MKNKLCSRVLHLSVLLYCRERSRFCRRSLRHKGVLGIGRLVVSLFTGSPNSKYVVYATACVYREFCGKITDRKKIV